MWCFQRSYCHYNRQRFLQLYSCLKWSHKPHWMLSGLFVKWSHQNKLLNMWISKPLTFDQYNLYYRAITTALIEIFLTSLSTLLALMWLMLRWLDVTRTLRWTFRLTALVAGRTGGSSLPAGAKRFEKPSSGNSCCFPRQQQPVLENLRWPNGSSSPHNSNGPNPIPSALSAAVPSF